VVEFDEVDHTLPLSLCESRRLKEFDVGKEDEEVVVAPLTLLARARVA